jgi:hypothetical protein
MNKLSSGSRFMYLDLFVEEVHKNPLRSKEEIIDNIIDNNDIGFNKKREDIFNYLSEIYDLVVEGVNND